MMIKSDGGAARVGDGGVFGRSAYCSHPKFFFSVAQQKEQIYLFQSSGEKTRIILSETIIGKNPSLLPTFYSSQLGMPGGFFNSGSFDYFFPPRVASPAVNLN